MKKGVVIMSILSIIMAFVGCGKTNDIDIPATSTKVGEFNLLTPDNNISSDSQPSFTWSKSENAVQYKFQISQESDFATLDFEKNVCENSYKLESILEGNRVYYWRVVAVGSTGRTRVATNSAFVLNTEYRYLSIASIYRDNMVIQRDKLIKIWGYAKKSKSVKVEFNGITKEITSDNEGYYSAEFDSLPSSIQPKTIKVESESENLLISNILIGDIFLVAGQSNIQWPLKDSDYKQEDLNLQNPNSLRLFMQNDNPQNDVQKQVKNGYWFIPDGTAELNYSALSYLIGYMLEEYNSNNNVPIGMIFSAKGDTHIQQWMSNEAFNEDFTSVNNGYSENAYYNGMIAPLVGSYLTGIIWYQGENNAWDSSTYKQYLLNFASDYRQKFNNDKLPIFIVQLPKYSKDIPENMWAQFRLEQDKAVENDEYMHLIVTYDGGDLEQIHPQQKRYIAERFMLLYRKYVLNEDILADSPKFLSLENKGNYLIISFKNALGLYSTEEIITGFELAGLNNIYKKAEAELLSDGTIKVSSLDITQPLYVRYCYSNDPIPVLFNNADLPLASFWYK